MQQVTVISATSLVNLRGLQEMQSRRVGMVYHRLFAVHKQVVAAIIVPELVIDTVGGRAVDLRSR